MKLLAYTIGGVQYLCNPEQIKEAGGLEQAAKKLHEKANPAKATEEHKSKTHKGETKPLEQ